MEYLKLDKKMIKFIETVNQAMKKIFTYYVITDDGAIFAPPYGGKMPAGMHFSHSDNVKILRDLISVTPGCVGFDPTKIFEAIKEYKRSGIKDVVIVDNIIGFILNDDSTVVPIGHLFPSDYSSEVQAYIKTKIGRFTEDAARLNDDEMHSLVEGEIIMVERDKFRMKLSKEIVPFVKTDTEVKSLFIDSGDEETFEVMLSTSHDVFTTYHIYKCIHINLLSF